MKKLRNNKIRKLLAFMVALALMVSCMPSAYTISASEAFGDGTEDIFTDGEFTSEPAAEESTPDVSSADQEETEQAQQSTLTYENDSVKVTAEALEDGALPQNTALKADGVNENSSVSYDTVSQKLSAAATDKGSSLRGFFAYDVYFADGDGNRVEPNGRVRVTFEYKTPAAPELTDAASTSVTVEKLHYNSSTGDTDVNTLQANEDLKVLNVNEGKQIQTLQVETGNAAVFAVMWDSPETADVEAEAVSGNEDEVPIASEEATDGMDISDEPEQDAAETPAAENPEVTPEAEPSEEPAVEPTEAPAENPDAEPTEAPAEDPDVVEEPAEDIASPDEVPAADENGETSLIEVLGDDTNLRVSPSIEAEVLATVNAGTQLTLLDTVTAEDGATWYKVSWEGTEAYIRSDMAQVVDSSDEAEEVEDVLESEEVSYSQEVGNVVVTATAAKGVIPEGAQFVVTPIEKGSDQYADIEKQLHEGAENESYTVAGFLAYDISFLNDDGTKIEPQNGSVRVSIAYKEAEIPEDVAETDTAQENMNVSLVHFVEDANGNVTEVVNMSNDGQAEVSTTDNGEIESANFETESFSTFSVVWLADDFTSVQTTSSDDKESTVDSAASGITINMFNYNTAEINKGHSLQFSNGRDGVWDYNAWTGSANPYSNIMKKTLGKDSYPVLNKGNEESSSYLFSTDSGTGKTVYSDANYLFKKDADGYYEYDSAKNFAQFDEKTKHFTVYKVPGSSTNVINLQKDSGNKPHGSFFPFNTLGDSIYEGIHEISGNSPDFHFGMTMSAKFIQPKDGKINGNNMVFEFSGDDDVWVYIDGVLVLDIGGIHNAASGSINFANGNVTVGNNNNLNLRKLFADANEEGDFVSGENRFADYTMHTINFYYLERGEGDSNCKLKFNLPTVPKKSVTVEKQLSNTDKEKYADVEFKFQLLVKNAQGKYVPSNTKGILSDGKNVEFKSETINNVSYNNVFTLKPGQHATFSGLEENKNYKVQELDVSADKYEQVLINGKNATNQNGNVISSEATVDSRQWVTVTNVLASVAELDFKKVNTKGEALSGAGFTLTSQDDNSKTYTAESGDDGIIKFENLPLGTYTLTETRVPNKYENRNTWIVKVEKDEAGTAVATLYEADGKTVVKKDSKDSYYHIVNYTHQELIESDVEYSKKAHVIDWENRTYKIDISAASKCRSQSTVVTGAADIMLVLDVSGSMNNSILAGDGSNDYPGIASSAECAKTADDAAGLSELFRTFEQTIFNDVDITNATITDTIDPRFDLLDDAGKIITEESLANGPLTLENGGVVRLVNGNLQVQWTNVTIPKKKKNNPWTKSLNIKAKDTYIGGNDVTTNVREGSNITFGNEKIYLPQPKVNVNAKIFINDKEITIYKGDTIPTDGEILNKLFKASDVTSYKDGKVGTADIVNIQLKWYKNPKCTEPVATDTKGNPVYDLGQLSDSDKQPTADTNYYLKVTYNAGAPSEGSKKNTNNNVAGGEDNIQEAINEKKSNNPYGIYTIHVISGKIDIIKKVEEKSSVDREFQFNVKTEDGDDAFKGKGKTFTLTVSKDSLTGELTDADKKTLENLSRGTYVVSEVNVPDGYKIAGTDIAVETNCQNSVENNETTFVLGNSKQTPNTDVISSEYTYNPNDGGVLGKVSYINEYSVNLDLKKVDSSGNNELSGAEFTLEVKDGTTGQFDGNAYKPFEIDKDTVELKDLKPGLYKLTEIKAPKGYSLLETSIYFQVKLGKVTLVKEDGTPIEVQPQSMWTLDEDGNVLTIKNTKLYSLPNSGGPGTYGFTISGVAILATALLLFINNKRREEEAKRS